MLEFCLVSIWAKSCFVSFVHDARIIDTIGTGVFKRTVRKRTTRVLVVIPCQTNFSSMLSSIGTVAVGVHIVCYDQESRHTPSRCGWSWSNACNGKPWFSQQIPHSIRGPNLSTGLTIGTLISLTLYEAVCGSEWKYIVRNSVPIPICWPRLR